MNIYHLQNLLQIHSEINVPLVRFSCLFVFPNVFVYHRFCNGCQLPSNGWEELIQASWTEKPAASKIDKAASTWDVIFKRAMRVMVMRIADDQNRRNLLHRLHLPVVDQNNWVAGHKTGLGSWTEHCHLEENVTKNKKSRESPPCWHPALSSPPHPSCDGSGWVIVMLFIVLYKKCLHRWATSHLLGGTNLWTRVSPHLSLILPLFNSILRSGSLVGTASLPSFT